MARLDDEVQREMTRYCAGIDQWDAMPVVVEGWLRVFEGLQQQRDELLAALKIWAPDVCLEHCSGGFVPGDKIKHAPVCDVIRSAIAKAEGK